MPPELNPRGRRAARREEARRAAGMGNSSILHGATLGLRIVAAALSLLVLVGSGWAWATYRNFNADIRRVQITTCLLYTSDAADE